MKSKIILEFCSNHQGNIDIAKQMIDEAAKLKVWGVKFQKRDVKSMPCHLLDMQRGGKNDFGDTYRHHRQALEFNTEQMIELKKYTEDKGLKFIVSVFDPFSLTEMAAIGCEYIKLPSQLFSNYEMNIYMRAYQGFKLVSTGMHTLKEVLDCPFVNNFDVLFFCRSIYPCTLKQINFIDMVKIKQRLINPIGYSSHDKEGAAIKYAVLLGATYIERHYTLDKSMKGSDQSTVSSDYDDIVSIKKGIDWAEQILGEANNPLCEEERKVKSLYRSTY